MQLYLVSSMKYVVWNICENVCNIVKFHCVIAIMFKHECEQVLMECSLEKLNDSIDSISSFTQKNAFENSANFLCFHSTIQNNLRQTKSEQVLLLMK